MNKIVLQNIVFPFQEDETEALYYRLRGSVGNSPRAVCLPSKRQFGNGISLKKGSTLSTDTYFNLFDIEAWHKYTGLMNWELVLQLEGVCCLSFYQWNGKKTLISEQEIKADKKAIVETNFSWSARAKMIFFEIEAKEDVVFYQGEYRAEILPEKRNPIHLSLLICTYKREQELCEIITTLKKSLFFDQASSYYGGMSVRIVDNATELPEIDEPYISLYHNPNTGGSGGFTRGLSESRRDATKYGISHVVFMDDDVKINMETFYRLYALLSLMIPCYQEEVVGGRMFRLDRAYIQYTAAEIWNKGDVKHIGHEQDMRKEEGLPPMNQKLGQYAGWWFACYPMSFAGQETPFPFFLHCDDVEYGLRHGGNPILLNGIQVWHETYENRMSPLIRYYDQRNSMIVNTFYQLYQNERELFNKWFMRVLYDIRARKFQNLYPTLVALQDYVRGIDFFLSNTSKKNVDLPRIFKGWMILPWILLQIPILRCRIKGAYKSYTKE